MEDTLTCLSMGAVETLIVWENLEVNRHVLKNHTTDETVVKHLTPEQEKDTSNFVDKATGVELEPVEKLALLEWFANEYKRFGCQLEFVTNRSQEGSQFVRGFGGIGGCLRYQVNLSEFQHASDEEDHGELYAPEFDARINLAPLVSARCSLCIVPTFSHPFSSLLRTNFRGALQLGNEELNHPPTCRLHKAPR